MSYTSTASHSIEIQLIFVRVIPDFAYTTIQYYIPRNNIFIPTKSQELFYHLIVNQVIATIKELQVLTIRLSNALVHSIVDTFIWLTAPIGELTLMFLYELFRAICGTTINDNPLEILTGLRNYAFISPLQSLQVIIVYRDY